MLQGPSLEGLGTSREALGRLLGTLWRLSGGSWAHLGASKSSFCTALGRDGLQDGLQGAIWMDLGRIWEGLGLILGVFWGGVGRRISIITIVLACVRATARHSYSRRVFVVKIGFRAESLYSR